MRKYPPKYVFIGSKVHMAATVLDKYLLGFNELNHANAQRSMQLIIDAAKLAEQKPAPSPRRRFLGRCRRMRR